MPRIARATSVLAMSLVALAVAGCAGSGSSDQLENPSRPATPDDIKVVAANLVDSKARSRGNYGDALVLVRNTVDQPLIVVAKLSIYSHGKRVKTTIPAPVAVSPNGEGVLASVGVRLPKSVRSANLRAKVGLDSQPADFLPIEVTGAGAEPDETTGGCLLTGTVETGLDYGIENLEVRAVALDRGRQIVSGGVTIVQRAAPEEPASFEIRSGAACEGDEKVEGFPASQNLNRLIFSGR